MLEIDNIEFVKLKKKQIHSIVDYTMKKLKEDYDFRRVDFIYNSIVVQLLNYIKLFLVDKEKLTKKKLFNLNNDIINIVVNELIIKTNISKRLILFEAQKLLT